MPLARIFLTGEPGSGKTTAIRKISQSLQDRGVTIGGMISREIRENGRRTGFQLEDITSHQVGVLAQLNKSLGAAVGRYGVNLNDLDRVGVAAIKRAVNDADVVVVDEIGPMELKSQEFVLAVETALASKKSSLSTVHKRASHHLLNAIRANPNYRIIEVTSTNRDRLALEIVAEFM